MADIIHIMVTSKCKRDCKYCCNKQYDLNAIPYVTEEELKEATTICITGGEPFAFTDPCAIARYFRKKYDNIENIYVYTNAYELDEWMNNHRLHDIDGLSVSIKNRADLFSFMNIERNDDVRLLKSNRLYVFDNLYPPVHFSFKVLDREWQEHFAPAQDGSIFRRI